MLNSLLDKSLHKKVLLLTLPMVLSNITIPLLGLIDAAVIGHLEHAWYLGGVAVGNIMVNVILMLCAFLRMATTGITAQAYGAKDHAKQANLLFQALFIAVAFGLLLLIFAQPLVKVALFFNSASREIKFYAQQYFSIRIISAPAALGNLVIIGWLLGRQNVKPTMLILIATNLLNIMLDIIFVVYLLWGVQGAASASVIADYIGFILALYFVYTTWPPVKLLSFKKITIGIEKLFQLNFDIFIRSLCLQLTFGFMVFYGTAISDLVAAANAILMSFLMLISYTIDGFAYSMEALVGAAIGGENSKNLSSSIIVITFWSLLIVLILTIIFIFKGSKIIALISDIPDVQHMTILFLPWLAAFPLISMWCFLLDGIFIGAVQGRTMRNSMIIASASFFITWWLAKAYDNHALWAAMLVFMAIRALLLSSKLRPLINKYKN